MRLKVLVSAPYFLPMVEHYRPLLQEKNIDLIVADVNERLEEDHLLRYIDDIDGMICGDDRVTPRVLEKASRLKVIAKWGTGIDSIDKVEAERRGIRVCNTLNAFTLPVSDSVLGYILAFARQQPLMDKMMKQGLWDKIPGHSLSESTLGVIGVGNCGKAVIRRAEAFGMKILGNDIRPIESDFIAERRLEMVPLEHLLSVADYVSLNCDLTQRSHHIISTRTLAVMKPTAVLINTARGPLVDEPALIHALQHEIIRGAALDVFEVEPLPKSSPLLEMDNVMLAPHNANSSPQAWERVHESTVRQLLAVLCPA